jgi:uric acid transporter
MHLAEFGNVADTQWFGALKFAAQAIITMCIVMIVTYTESTTDMLAVAEMVNIEFKSADLACGLATDGLSAILASLTISFPTPCSPRTSAW